MRSLLRDWCLPSLFASSLLLAACGDSGDDSLFQVQPGGLGGAAGSAGAAAGKGGSAGASAGASQAGKGGASGAGAAGKSGQGGVAQGGAGAGGKAQGGAGAAQGGAGAAQGGAGAAQGGAGAAQGGAGAAQGGAGAAQGGAGMVQGGSSGAGASGEGGQGGEAAGASGGQAGAGEGGASQGGASGEAGQGGAGEGGAGQGGAGSGGDGGVSGSSGQAGASGAGEGGASGGSGQAGTAGAAGGPVNNDKCPGEVISVGTEKVKVQGSTQGKGDDYGGPCGGGSSNEVVYTVTADFNGYLQVRVSTGGHRPALYVRNTCGQSNSATACDATFNGDTATVQVPVTAGSTFFVFVDGAGFDNQNGPFTLELTPSPSVCGNGVIEPGEACDDTDNDAQDGCDACALAPDCNVVLTGDTSAAEPAQAPAGCEAVTFSPASLPGNSSDNDWYCVQLMPGQTLVATTYTGVPGQCSQPPSDTIMQLFKGVPSSPPDNSSCLLTPGNVLACNDDRGDLDGGCSQLSYKVPSGQGGEYCARVTRKLGTGGIASYGVTFQVK